MKLKPTKRNINLLNQFIKEGGVVFHRSTVLNRFNKDDNTAFFLHNKTIYIKTKDEYGESTWDIAPTDELYFENVPERFYKKG